MKSKHFSNDFGNKMQEFHFNTGQPAKPLPALVSNATHDGPLVINRLKNQNSE